jgi:N-formylglutamate deformylase
MTNLILHIPHSSDKIPMDKGFVVDEKILAQEIIKLTDWYTDDLFLFEDSIIVQADFSRIFCDTERFSNDSQEVMAKYGMGVLYEKSDDGSVIREVNTKLREDILNNYYWPHHNKLNQAVNDQLISNGRALIVDCHSFPSDPLIRDLSQDENRPDFNIGTDSFHTPNDLIEISKYFFKEKGYSLGVDRPYSGTMVPINHYQKTKNVSSIMLEINRALYLNEPGNQKSSNYLSVKKTVNEYLKLIQTAYDKSSHRAKISENNKWLFPTDGFGEMEKGRTNSNDIYDKSRKDNTDL